MNQPVLTGEEQAKLANVLIAGLVTALFVTVLFGVATVIRRLAFKKSRNVNRDLTKGGAGPDLAHDEDLLIGHDEVETGLSTVSKVATPGIEVTVTCVTAEMTFLTALKIAYLSIICCIFLELATMVLEKMA